MTIPPNIPERSPFKFLDPYGKEDRKIFFGREEEIEELYEKLQLAKLVLVYGASGTGKTSLINCGLANKFTSSDWFAVFVRRGNNLLESLHREISARAIEPLPEGSSLADAVESLYFDHYIPIYLIFDQFEEIFIEGSKEEQQEFFHELSELLRSRVSCKVLIAMREEYLAYLSDYEKELPILFDNRFRVEKMQPSQLEEVVKGTAKEFGIALKEPEQTVEKILENLRDVRREVDLTNLQVYMDRLYRLDKELQAKKGEDRPVSFSPSLVDQVGKLPQVLGKFLDEQLAEAGRELGKPNLPLEVLMALVTNDGTKRSLSVEELQQQLHEKKGISPEEVTFCIKKFYENRILRELKIG